MNPIPKAYCDLFAMTCKVEARLAETRGFPSANLIGAVLVTRGDVDMEPIMRTIPHDWEEELLWNNAFYVTHSFVDLRPFGQFYAALVLGRTPFVYFQDDDVLVDTPEAVVTARLHHTATPDAIVCNMPQTHRPNYVGQLDRLMGFGSCFRRVLIAETFNRYFKYFEPDDLLLREPGRIFTGLNHDKLVEVDVPKRDRECEANPNRLWRQPDHIPMRDEARRRVAHILEAEAQCQSN